MKRDYKISFGRDHFIEVKYREKRNTNEPLILYQLHLLKCVNCTISTPLMTLDKSSRAQELLAELIATRACNTRFLLRYLTRETVQEKFYRV
jgi:hypothetical protein